MQVCHQINILPLWRSQQLGHPWTVHFWDALVRFYRVLTTIWNSIRVWSFRSFIGNGRLSFRTSKKKAPKAKRKVGFGGEPLFVVNTKHLLPYWTLSGQVLQENQSSADLIETFQRWECWQNSLKAGRCDARRRRKESADGLCDKTSAKGSALQVLVVLRFKIWTAPRRLAAPRRLYS